MITIGKIPKKLHSFFKPIKKQVSEHVYGYFWSMVLSICISHGCTIDRLVKLLRNSTHRTNHGEFLWRSNWSESAVKRKLAKYGKNVLRNSGTWCNIAGLRKTKKYRLAERIGKLNKLGTVKIVFSRRRADRKHIAIVTDDLRALMRTVVADYLKRWSIEMLIKDEG